MHIVLRSQTVLHTLQQKRTSNSLFCSSPRGFPFARAVTSSSSSSFSCCLFPYVSIICLSYFSLWFSNFRSPPLAHNWRKWGISSPASPSPHPNSCLFLFSQEPHFLLLNQYSMFALWEPGKYCSQPSQRVNSESIFFLMKCLGFSDVNHGLIWSSICWLHFLGPVSLNSYCSYESPVYFQYTHACWCLSPYIFFLSSDISPGEMHLQPAAPEWAGRSAGPHCSGTWSFLSAFSFAESLLLGFAPVCRWAHSPVVSWEKACSEGVMSIMSVLFVLHIRENEEAGLSYHQSGSLWSRFWKGALRPLICFPPCGFAYSGHVVLCNWLL